MQVVVGWRRREGSEEEKHPPCGGLVQPARGRYVHASGRAAWRICAGCGCLSSSGCATGKVFAVFPEGQPRAVFRWWKPCRKLAPHAVL